MIRLTYAVAFLISVTGIAEPHRGGDKGKPAPASNGGRDRTQKPLFEPYPATVRCDYTRSDYPADGIKTVQEMRAKRNEQLIAASHLPSLEAMKRILSENVDSMRQGAIRPDRKEKEDNEYLEKFGVSAKPAPDASAVIKTAVALLDSPVFREREIATQFLSAMGPRVLREQAVEDGFNAGSPEQRSRLERIRTKVLEPTSVRLISTTQELTQINEDPDRIFNDHDWKSIFLKASGELNKNNSTNMQTAVESSLIAHAMLTFGKESFRLDRTLGGYSRPKPEVFLSFQLEYNGKLPSGVVGCAHLGLENPGWLEFEVTIYPAGNVKVTGNQSDRSILKTPNNALSKTHPYKLVEERPSFKTLLANLVTAELEAKSPSPPTADDLAWLAAWKEVREKAGLDKADDKPEDAVAPLIKALESGDFRVRYLARELLEFYGPALKTHPAWIEATKYPGEWTPVLRQQIASIQKAQSAMQTAPEMKK